MRVIHVLITVAILAWLGGFAFGYICGANATRNAIFGARK